MNRKILIKKSLPEKKEFYTNLNMEDITDADYMHAKWVCKGFEIKIVGEYHDLYLQVMCHYWQMFLKTLEKCGSKSINQDPAKFVLAPRLAWQADLKMTEVKLELPTNAEMLLMVEKVVRWEISHAINTYSTANNKYMKIMIKNLRIAIF